jgi:hypothetical protein
MQPLDAVLQPFHDALAARDDVYIIMAAFLIANRLLTDSDYMDMFRFAYTVDLGRQDIMDTEREFANAIEYSAWVRDDEFYASKKKLDELWDLVYDPDLAVDVD